MNWTKSNAWFSYCFNCSSLNKNISVHLYAVKKMFMKRRKISKKVLLIIFSLFLFGRRRARTKINVSLFYEVLLVYLYLYLSEGSTFSLVDFLRFFSFCLHHQGFFFVYVSLFTIFVFVKYLTYLGSAEIYVTFFLRSTPLSLFDWYFFFVEEYLKHTNRLNPQYW